MQEEDLLSQKEKNIYRASREAVEMTREDAAEKLVFISEDRLERIENEKSAPHPDEVLAMAEQYKNPSICNYFCANECPLGKDRVKQIELKDLSQITLEILATINALSNEKDRLVEITVDGDISLEEMQDFDAIRENLDKMSTAIDSLKLWMDHTTAQAE